MGSSKSLFFALFALWFGNWCEAYQFYVGGRDGWVLKPSESYSDWPHRLRFQVNDTLLFKYKKGSDSVLVVNRDDFDKCNKANPIVKMDGGDSVFKLDRSGPFYFISGQDDNCQNGQKLLIVVLAIRSPPATSPSPTSPAPAKSPESHSPANPPRFPAPANPPESPAPVTETPSPAPSAVTPTMSQSPGSPPEPFSPEANSPPPSPSSDESSPPAPAKSSSESVTPSVLVLLVTGLFGAAVIAH